MIRALLFDRDGVLTDFDAKAASAAWADRLPVSVESLCACWAAWEGDARATTDFSARVRERLGLDSTQFQRLLREDFASFFRPFPETADVLRTARARGFKIGVLTNCPLPNPRRPLEAAGLGAWIDAVWSAEEIGAAKPTPAAYLRATAALGVAPEECLFFDDQEKNVRGARRLGMESYRVDRSGDPSRAPTHSLRLQTLPDLRPVLARLDQEFPRGSRRDNSQEILRCA